MQRQATVTFDTATRLFGRVFVVVVWWRSADSLVVRRQQTKRLLHASTGRAERKTAHGNGAKRLREREREREREKERCGGGAAGRRERKRTCTARMHRLAQLITCCCSHYTMQLQYACCCNVDEMISSDIHLSSFSLLRFPIYSNRSLHVSRPWRIQKL